MEQPLGLRAKVVTSNPPRLRNDGSLVYLIALSSYMVKDCVDSFILFLGFYQAYKCGYHVIRMIDYNILSLCLKKDRCLFIMGIWSHFPRICFFFFLFFFSTSFKSARGITFPILPSFNILLSYSIFGSFFLEKKKFPANIYSEKHSIFGPSHDSQFCPTLVCLFTSLNTDVSLWYCRNLNYGRVVWARINNKMQQDFSMSLKDKVNIILMHACQTIQTILLGQWWGRFMIYILFLSRKSISPFSQEFLSWCVKQGIWPSHLGKTLNLIFLVMVHSLQLL